MKHYEIILMFRVGQTEQVDKLIKNYQSSFAEKDSSIHRFEDWGKLVLSYPVKEEKSARYILMNVECSVEAIEKFKESIRFNDFILRSLILKKNKVETGESIMLQQLKENK